MLLDAILADSVASAEGKLYIQGGGWNSILAQGGFPTRHPRIGIGAVIRVPYTATNQTHTFTVRVEDSDGQPLPLGDAPPGTGAEDGRLYELVGNFTIGRPPTLVPGDEQIVPLAINLDGLVFPKPDAFRVVITLDGEPMETISFRVVPPIGVQLASATPPAA